MSEVELLLPEAGGQGKSLGRLIIGIKREYMLEEANRPMIITDCPLNIEGCTGLRGMFYPLDKSGKRPIQAEVPSCGLLTIDGADEGVIRRCQDWIRAVTIGHDPTKPGRG